MLTDSGKTIEDLQAEFAELDSRFRQLLAAEPAALEETALETFVRDILPTAQALWTDKRILEHRRAALEKVEVNAATARHARLQLPAARELQQQATTLLKELDKQIRHLEQTSSVSSIYSTNAEKSGVSKELINQVIARYA